MNEVKGPIGDGKWEICLGRGRAIEIWVADNEGDGAVITVKEQHAQDLRDFARNLERAADYLEGTVAAAARQPLLDEIGHLRKQLEAADKRNGELAAENAVLKDRIEQKDLLLEGRIDPDRSAELAMCHARIEGLEFELADYERSMENANKEIRRLREELADYKGDGYFDPELEDRDVD